MPWLWVGLALVVASWTWRIVRAPPTAPPWITGPVLIAGSLWVAVAGAAMALWSPLGITYLPWPLGGWLVVAGMAVASLAMHPASRVAAWPPWSLPAVLVGLAVLAVPGLPNSAKALVVAATATVVAAIALRPEPRRGRLAVAGAGAAALSVPLLLAAPWLLFLAVTGGFGEPAEYEWEASFSPTDPTTPYVLHVPLPTYAPGDDGAARRHLWDAIVADGDWHISDETLVVNVTGPWQAHASIRFTAADASTFPDSPSGAVAATGTGGALHWRVDYSAVTCSSRWAAEVQVPLDTPAVLARPVESQSICNPL